jgi:hypothetical protein
MTDLKFSDEDWKRLEERMNRVCSLWDSERKDHIHKCRTLDIAFREATDVFNAIGPLLARLEAAEWALQGFIALESEKTNYDEVCQRLDAWRKACGK